MMKLMTAAAVFLCLTGCAVSPFGSATAGSAVYHYESIRPDGSKCSLEITSARTVTGGDIEIGPNCELKSMADDAGGAKEALQKIGEIVNQVVP